MKKIILILFVLLLCGCENKASEYKEVSDIVVRILQDKSYNNSNLNDKQISLINNYEERLKNPEIEISKYIIYKDYYKTTEKNTPGIYTKENKCYILYNDIEFPEMNDPHSESMANLVCNGYRVVILEDSVKPQEIDNTESKHNYRYLGYYKDKGYNYAYRSYLDGSGLIVKIDDKVEVEYTNVDALELKTIQNKSIKKYILPSIIVLLVIITSIILKKKEII